MAKTEMFLAVGILLITAAGSVVVSEDCDFDDFGVCRQEVVALKTGDFNVVSEEQMKEVCNAKREAIECASDFVRNCMKKGERDVYEATTGGRLKVVADMCTDGTRIHKGFVQNMECFGKIQDEINFCNEKFQESQEALNKANMQERLKVFYICCVFSWHRNCLTKAARMKCNDQAADFVNYVSTVRLGQIQNQICSSSYSSCHGLYGVEEIEEFENDADALGHSGVTSLLFPNIQTLLLLLLTTAVFL